ncbi:MAG TPA: hypothetical protein VGS80_25390, partial [Ktedonobacterales bacterium]|nr:hypothetical protein [Ktedonobacterales bacterium]
MRSAPPQRLPDCHTGACSLRQAAADMATGLLADVTAPHRLGCTPAACAGLKPLTFQGQKAPPF